MANQLSVSLRAWPSDDKTTESLPFLIARINEQRGSFRNITEASLEEEIRASDADDSKTLDGIEMDEEAEDDNDAKSKGEELAVAREEIIKQVGEAYKSSSHALDLVSLLLSSHVPKAAEATISPFIKAAVPFGSLSAEIMQQPQRSNEENISEGLVNIGWRMQSLSRSADALLRSASSLGKEIRRETTYWQEILAVKEKGWPVCRLPREKHTLGVRFGFSEAHAEFRDRGLAALRRGPDGKIELDRGPRWQKDQRLVVRLLKDRNLAATSERSQAASDDDQPLIQHLLRARNSLFDEELYHEINREARNLVNQGVRCIGSAIQLPFRDDNEIEIDLVPMDEVNEPVNDESAVPSAILMALRILLSHAHQQNHILRSRLPPPITDSQPPRPFYSLLRPILELNQHDLTSREAKHLLGNLKLVTSAASIPVMVEETASSNLFRVPDDMSNPKASTIEILMNHLTSSHHTQLTLHLPSNYTSLTLDIHTSILPPNLGTSLQLSTATSATDSAIAQMPHTLHFPTLGKLWKHVEFITSLDIVALLQASAHFPKWLVLKSPYEAYMVGNNPETVQKDRLRISFEAGGLKAVWCKSEKAGSHSWAAEKEGKKNPSRSLINMVVAELG
ncbi:MAG: hypothetical protein L6R37_001088 [Teloschistes peruensis]|nr:MAG: hypothetical protein L6R37_001088 [Teloschistes peruensis]